MPSAQKIPLFSNEIQEYITKYVLLTHIFVGRIYNNLNVLQNIYTARTETYIIICFHTFTIVRVFIIKENDHNVSDNHRHL